LAQKIIDPGCIKLGVLEKCGSVFLSFNMYQLKAMNCFSLFGGEFFNHGPVQTAHREEENLGFGFDNHLWP
jgi:hypothetical protein